MSYCFNPHCPNPQNPGEGELCQHCGASVKLSPPMAGSANSRYTALELLGQGGFGRTFLAVDQLTPDHPQVAIKQFFPLGNNAKGAAELFRQEAQQLEILGEHPQIPNRVAYFESEPYQYLVQEFIEGNNLAQELMLKGPFTENQIYQVLDELLPVLQFIHSHKVIHRDIKPENIIRRQRSSKGSENTLVLVDFGAAKLVTGGLLPKTGTLIGSAAYTAPEQLMGKAVFASDIYSLGVTCIHLLTGVTPFDLFDGHEGNWGWRSYLKSPVSDELGDILDRMLAGATSKRFHSAAALLLKLHPTPKYIEAMPGFKPEPETGFVAIATNKTPIKQPIKPSKLPQEEPQITKVLQKALKSYKVKVQVNRISKSKLTIVINRAAKPQVDYPQIAKAIASELTQLNLKNIVRVKLLGRVQNRGVPEWQMVLKLDPKARRKNQRLRFKQYCHNLISSQHWRKRIHSKQFWMDTLTMAMVAYIFSNKFIVFTPLVALLISPMFIIFKNWIKPYHDVNENQVFAIVVGLFLMLEFLQFRLVRNDLFGIIIAGMFVSMPLFSNRNN
ncbi:MAG: serine/threonine protein kinase [Arthrospira sp. SH-MAG29]|nr:serine/threonine-protein kinase [Arthrospira sp. SH-MAG29]MBS0018038.1 serine/threonine protein kinase [Arthrospira sp. SH-MAG29]